MENKPDLETNWLDKVKHTYKCHVEQLRLNPKWRIEDTARFLNQSKGLTSEQLKVANWLKSYPELEKFDYFKDAIEFIRAKAHKLKIEEVEL